MSIRLKEDTIQGFREIKQLYDLKSLDEAAKLAIKNTPLRHSYETEPPALVLPNKNDPGDDLFITWSDLKNSETSKEWGDLKNNEIVATVLFKDDYGVLIRFRDSNQEIYIDYYRFI
ncbi:MAG: hypothetical protein FWH29_04520 [Methanobrevibacter sp.]|nr:hypothetical protein [Methanobrevibacter sp.]